MFAFSFDPGLTARWPAAVAAHKAHAHSSWPQEAGGLVLEDGTYAAMANVAEDPVRAFEFDPAEVTAASGDRYVAVLHSHCSVEGLDGRVIEEPHDCPSGADMQGQMDTAVPWGITLCMSTGASAPFWFGDEVPRPPLLGRVFRHGVDDCYSLVRDWHRETFGIELPDFVRDPDWWMPGEGQPQLDLYASFFEQAGFHRVNNDAHPRPAGPLPGDCFICRVRSPVLNHAGVYIGNGLVLHHLAHQLSTRDPASAWRSKLDFLVRHNDVPDDWRPEDAENN